MKQAPDMCLKCVWVHKVNVYLVYCPFKHCVVWRIKNKRR